MVDTMLRLEQAFLHLMGDGIPAVHAQASIHCDLNVAREIQTVFFECGTYRYRISQDNTLAKVTTA